MNYQDWDRYNSSFFFFPGKKKGIENFNVSFVIVKNKHPGEQENYCLISFVTLAFILSAQKFSWIWLYAMPFSDLQTHF